jgi:hypothetical protein
MRTDGQTATELIVAFFEILRTRVKTHVEGMCGLDSTGSGNAVLNMVLSSRDWRDMYRGSILSPGYESVFSPARVQTLGPHFVC